MVECLQGSTDLVQYVYNGIATPVRTTYPQPNLSLDYTVAGALDRFGRITNHAWRQNTTDRVRIQHTYDRVGNRTNRTDSLHAANTEAYTYDGVNQIKSLGRTGFSETWNYLLASP